MLRLITIIYLIFLPCIIFSQDMIISPYNNIPDEIAGRNSFLREKWFYEQRMFPFGYIPADTYRNALIRKHHLRTSTGFYDNSALWISLGPTPGVNNNYGNVSSRIASVKFHPANPDIIYLAAAFGGVWKTTNSGVNWIPKSDFEVTLSSGSIAIDGANPNIIYYGTGEASYFTYSYAGSGLLKSTDGGETWQNYTEGLPAGTLFSRIALSPLNPQLLFAAMGTAGLYKSINGGVSWAPAVSGRCDDVLFSPDGSKVYCIGQGSGFRISSDGGNTFNVYSPFTLGTRNHLALCKSAPHILYSAVYQGTSVQVYKSTNGGINFILLPNNFTGANQGWYDFYIHVNPFNPDYAYVGLIDLWRTTDGANFTKITNTSAGPVHVDHHNLDFHPFDSAKLICANDGGVWYSTNYGTNWINLNATLNLTQFYRVAADPMNASHLIGGTQDNGVQRTTGSHVWNVWSFGGDGGDACFQQTDPNYILAENQFNRIKRSVNGGNSWVTDTSGLFGRAAWIGPLLSHPDSAGIFYTGREQVFKSTDWGDNWFAYSSGTAGILYHMAISKSNPLIMYASSNPNIFLSTNGGINFDIRTTGLPVRTITSINIHPDSSQTAIITFSGFGTGHIYKTTDLGSTWSDISGNLPDIPVNDGIFYYPGYATPAVLAATDIGVFISTNYGTTWSELAEGLPNTCAMHLDYNLQYNKLRVATHGRGVWEYSGNLIGIKNNEMRTPHEYKLYENYPNPFNPVTNLKFEISEPGLVILTVYDVAGREIETIIDMNLQPGIYEIRWDASSYPSGIYLCRLNAGKFSQTRKMVLIK